MDGGINDAGQTQEQGDQDGFVSQIAKSVFEPGVNSSVILSMNLCFVLLILVLFALFVLTGWNKHVLFLLAVTTLFWFSMIWFVAEISKVQSRPDNMPGLDPADTIFNETETENKKDR